MRSSSAARILLLHTMAAFLSACASSYTPVPAPPAPPPPIDDTYYPIPERHPGCVELITYSEEGEASWYSRTRRMHRTASGQPLDPNGTTAAHRYLPFGSQVRVTNLSNNRSMTLTINDRGPYTKGRIIDVSQRSARDLGFLIQGITRVRIETIEPSRSDC